MPILDDIKRGIGSLPRKILHIGANRGGEAVHYSRAGIEGYLVEAIPAIHALLEARCAKLVGQHAILACLDAAPGTVTFNVSSNFASSSLLDFGRHAVAYPEITYEDRLVLQTETADGLIGRGAVPADVDFAVLDVQGAELKVLRGATRILSSPDLLGLMIEVSSDPLYEGGATYLEICRFLEPFGFHTKAIEFNEDGWGDALFSRRYWKLSDADVPPLFRRFWLETTGRNIAAEGRCSQSSADPAFPGALAGLAVTGPRGPEPNIRTRAEPHGWWQVDFGEVRRFDEVVVLYALTERRGTSRAIRISVSDDGQVWRDLFVNEYAFGGVDGRPLRVPCPETRAKLLRIHATPGEPLLLNRVEIYDVSQPAE